MDRYNIEDSAKRKPLINLLRGWPSPSILPVSLLREASNKVFSDPSIYVPALQYGPDPGYQPLREALAEWLGQTYNVPKRPEEICITGGASQSIACVLASFTDPVHTRAVWAVMPCYYLACPIFADAGFGMVGSKLRGVPEDEEGIDLGWLERSLRECDEAADDKAAYKSPAPYRKLYRHIIYVVPTCANPSSKTMSLRRRQALVHLARKHDALIISDDVYDMLQWSISPSSVPSDEVPLISPLPRLSDIDIPLGPSPFDPPGHHFGHAISNGSFSKLVGPGIRTGWVHGTPIFATGLSQTGATRSGGAPSQLCAAIVTQLLVSGGLDQYLEWKTRPALRDRHGLIVRCVKRELGGLGVSVREEGERDSKISGGYFIWLTLPEGGPTAGEVAERARREENLVLASGGMFVVGDGTGQQSDGEFGRNIRLCFSWEQVDVVEEGVFRLGRVLRSFADGREKGNGEGKGAKEDFK